MKILLSYSRRDSSLANSIKLALENYNFTVWMDEHNMYYRDDLETRLKNTILASDYTLIIITPKSRQSAWVNWVMDFALKLERIDGKAKILPLLMSGNDVPAQWSGKPFGDFRTAILMEKNFREFLIEPLLRAIPAHESIVPKQERLDMEKINQDFFDDPRFVAIKSPMVGTFYRSPSPDKDPFVKVGNLVEKGQRVCIIEAMKLFNEIETEVKGIIVKVLVDDAAPVEYDQPLFLVDPKD